MSHLRSSLRRGLSLSAAAIVASFAGAASAAPPEPSGPHPRMLLDAKKRAVLKERARDPNSAISRAVRQCAKVGSNLQQEAKNLYMGLDWAAHATNCALAWHATGDAAHAKTAIHFFTALLDDWEHVGDGKGGDSAARHDSGYAIRALGVHTALVYDWLHDAPGMTPALLAKARQRFQAWSDWYYGPNGGYRFKDPGTNYHAGYLFAVTAMALAQGGEAGAAGAKLWRHVHDQVWEKEMRPAARPGALLDGGDWGEGWQYAPLAVASYSLAARAMMEQGVLLPELERWAEQLVYRDIHARTPNEKGMFVGGDTQNEAPNLPPNPWTLYGVIAGAAAEPAAAWARAETQRLGLKSEDKSFLLFEVLAEARNVKPTAFPREKVPTFYAVKGTGTIYARSSWSPNAVWMAMQCTKTIEVDHLPPNAGNFVLTRGADDLVVDPSPYGSLSSLTSNAPTVESRELPPDYKPGQGFWSEKTRYAWAYQTESSIVVARCDYADQYKFQENPSDVPMAMRDVVLVPSGGGDATVVVVDRAKTGGDAKNLFLRFRTTSALALDGRGASGKQGASSLAIRAVHQSSGKAEVKIFTKGDCFKGDATRGNCRAARFPVNDYALTLRGPDPLAIHVLDAAAATATAVPPVVTSVPGARLVSFERGKQSSTVVVADGSAREKLAYRARPGGHVVLDPPASSAGTSQVTAVLKDGQCDVTIVPAASGGLVARPLAIVLSERCDVKLDGPLTQPRIETALAVVGASGAGPVPASVEAPAQSTSTTAPPQVRSGRGCGCGEAPGRTSLLGDAVVVLGIVIATRRRR